MSGIPMQFRGQPRLRRIRPGSVLGAWIISCSLAVGAIGVAAAPTATPPVHAVRADGIRVDGLLKEPGWKNGPWCTSFTTPGTGGAPAPIQTRFAVRFDAAALYLAAVMDEPSVKTMLAKATERDGRVYSDDCIEFMIDPTGDRVEYYHFIVNSRGAIYDAQRRQGGHVGTEVWNCDAQAAAHVGPDAWSMELRVPLAELGLSARSTKQPWAIQVGRERHAGGRLELSSFAPCGGSFHVPETYAPLILDHAVLAPFLWEVQLPVGALVTEDKGRLQYRFRTLVTNRTGRFRFLRLRAILLRDGEELGTSECFGGLDADQRGTYAFSVPFPRPGPCLLRFALADRRTPDTALAVRTVPVTLTYTPLVIDVLRPFYRNTIYATENVREIVARVHINLPPERVRDMKVRALLRPTGAGAKPTATSPEVVPDGSIAVLRLPVRGLSVGNYGLEVTATLHDGKNFSVHTTIRKVPPAAEEWRMDENLVLLHNGKPFFPYGWFSAPPTEGEKLRSEGVNVIQDYNAEYKTVKELRAWLDQVRAQGLYACFYPWPSRQFMKNFTQPVSPEEEVAIRERIRAVRDHPGVFAWYLWDEPELRPLLVERAERLYQIIAEEDPYHPCIMLNDTIPGILKYRNGGDVLMPDPYPLFNRGGLAGRPIEYTGEFMKACRRASAGKKAWWITPQAFDYYMNNPHSRPPNLTELRNQQLQAIINGAHGIVWYTYSHRYNYPELDLGVSFLGHEARRLEPAILVPDTANVLTSKAPRQKHVQVATRRVNGDLVVFAVNTATEPQDVTFRFAGKTPAPARLWVVSEKRNLAVHDGVFSDRFDVYEGHIYTTSQSLGGGPTVAETRVAIAEAKRRLARPGNLAYRGRGATVTASSVNRYSGKPDMVIDGARKGKGWTDATWKQWPDWLEVRFPKPETVGRVRVWSSSIVKYEIQVQQGDKFVTVASGVRKSDASSLEATFPARPNVSAVRVVAKSATGAYSGIAETEVFAE